MSVDHSNSVRQCFALVPAAGTGSRMGASSVPKQYVEVNGKPLIWYAIDTLLRSRAVSAVVVVVSPDDNLWPTSLFSDAGPRLHIVRGGGNSRAETVANGLAAIAEVTKLDDVLIAVHDAARPCLSVEHLNAVIAAAMCHSAGAILAVPVADTLKRASDSSPHFVCSTVSREGLWHAQTPQVFELGLLRRALALAPQVTDEASAVEAMGGHPRLVMGDPTNLKITYPRDLALAEIILASRSRTLESAS